MHASLVTLYHPPRLRFSTSGPWPIAGLEDGTALVAETLPTAEQKAALYKLFAMELTGGELVNLVLVGIRCRSRPRRFARDTATLTKRPRHETHDDEILRASTTGSANR